MNKTLLGHLSAIFAVCAMSMCSRSLAVLSGYLTSTEVLMAALLMSVLVLNLIYLPRHRVKKRTQELTFAFAGLFGVSLWFYLRALALGRVGSETFALAYALAPVGCVLLLRITGRVSRVRGVYLGGFGFAAGGILLLAFSGSGLSLSLKGTLLLVGAALSLSAFFALYKTVVHTGHPVAILRRVLLWGAIFSIPLCFVFEFDVEHYLELFALTPALHLLLGAVALPCAAALAFGYSQKALGPERSAAYFYAMPIAPVLISAVSGAGSVAALVLVGTVLIIVGITLCVRK